MRLMLLGVGRMKAGPERTLLTRYTERAEALARPVGLTGFGWRELDESRGRAAPERMRDEARALAGELPPGARVLALDERGSPLSSPDFAGEIETARDAGRTVLALVIGGPDGLDPAFRSGADRVVSYGAATFPHQIVRILAAEQCYRAMTILARHPYHRA